MRIASLADGRRCPAGKLSQVDTDALELRQQLVEPSLVGHAIAIATSCVATTAHADARVERRDVLSLASGAVRIAFERERSRACDRSSIAQELLPQHG